MKPLYSPAQWSLIDLANQYGHKLDKKPFDERLEWGRSILPLIKNADGLMDLHDVMGEYIEKADEPELFTASLLNIWDICHNKPTGHYIELDSASSGCQLLSVLTRCITGMRNTGAIGHDVPDLYTTIYHNMLELNDEVPELDRNAVKKATVPYIYGSSQAPKTVFGKYHDVFEKAYFNAVPRAEVIKNMLIGAWDNNATSYEWLLPDGHTAHIKVITKREAVFYFNGQRFTYHFEEIGTKQQGEEGTKFLASRVTHSYDAYVLREVDARTDYNREQMLMAKEAIETCLAGETQVGTMLEVRKLEQLSKQFNQVSIKGAEEIKRGYLYGIGRQYLLDLLTIVNESLEGKPAQLKLIHDGFGALANHVNSLKTHYNNVLADSYRSDWLFYVIELLTGVDYRDQVEPVQASIYRAIRNNHYAIS